MGCRRADARAARRARHPLGAPHAATLIGVALSALTVAACAPAEESGSTGTTAEAGPAAGAPVHPAFTLDRQELEELLAGAPAQLRTAVDADPSRFLELVDEVLDEPAERTILVDKTTRLDESFAPDDLVELDTLADELTLSRAGHRLTADTVDALLEMSEAAERDAVTLVVSSAYRSYDYQADLFERWVDELGVEEAERVSARPGTSQHQLGTTVDFGCICDEFASQPAGRWLAEHAWRHGFSLSYPDGYEEVTGYSYEPWHFRYIGRAAARLEREYFDGIQQWMLEFLSARRADLEAARHDDR